MPVHHQQTLQPWRRICSLPSANGNPPGNPPPKVPYPLACPVTSHCWAWSIFASRLCWYSIGLDNLFKPSCFALHDMISKPCNLVAGGCMVLGICLLPVISLVIHQLSPPLHCSWNDQDPCPFVRCRGAPTEPRALGVLAVLSNSKLARSGKECCTVVQLSACPVTSWRLAK